MDTICPYVRYARKHEQGIRQGQVQAIDHRLFYCHSGNGFCQINEKMFPVSSGTVIYIPAGIPYRLLFEESLLVFSSCNFDFYQNNRHLSEPIPPVTSGEFQKGMILEGQLLGVEDIFCRPIHMEQVFTLEYRFFEIVEEF